MDMTLPPDLIEAIRQDMREAMRDRDRRIVAIIEEGKRFKEIFDRIRYRPEWRLVLKLDMNRYYFYWEWDDTCNFTAKPMMSRSAKYYLSPHMTQTEVVNRVFLAAVKAEEHETRERFKYKSPEGKMWRAPYNTHIDIDCLYDVATEYDVRFEKSQDGHDDN